MLCIRHIEHRHAINRRPLRRIRRRIDHIICTDDKGDIAVLEIAVDRFHLIELLVRNVRLAQQYIHVPGHSPRHRVNGKAHLRAAGFQ